MPKRSLMLAGGGVKIAFQAGVLQVWLDEAGVEFDHADAVSAACFNLAMWTQSMSGTQIADNWRNLHPIAALDVNWTQIPKLLYAESLLELDAFRQKVFPAWGLDWSKIRMSGREATFNVYNFSKQQLWPVTPREMSEDLLIACASLPLWFPPVKIEGETYIDAVFNTASNLEEAIRRGADELWVIWTTSQRGEWFNGFVGSFFGIFEATTNHAYKQMLARIERNNRALEENQSSEFGRHITVRELKAEVPVHYLLNFSRDRSAEAVNRGVEAARRWCDENGLGSRSGTGRGAEVHAPPVSLRFVEVLKGNLGPGAIEARLEIQIDDIERFITNTEHEASVAGVIVCDALGGELHVTQGRYNLFVNGDDPAHKKVLYGLNVRANDGTIYTLAGAKDLYNDPGRDSISDPATLSFAIYAGSIPSDAWDSTEPVGRGIMRAGALDFIKHLASFSAGAPTLAGRASAVRRFGAFYLGRLWDVYARGLLPYSPF